MARNCLFVLMCSQATIHSFICNPDENDVTELGATNGQKSAVTRPGFGVSRYVNVADGGVAEVTYTFHRPAADKLVVDNDVTRKGGGRGATSGSLSLPRE
jgi:hypothetical protein